MFCDVSDKNHRQDNTDIAKRYLDLKAKKLRTGIDIHKIDCSEQDTFISKGMRLLKKLLTFCICLGGSQQHITLYEKVKHVILF